MWLSLSPPSQTRIVSVAFLGPQHSFSHEFVTAHLKECDEKLCSDFSEVFETLGVGAVDAAVVPLENSNAHSIQVAQAALLSRRGKIFVNDIVAHHVRLHLYSFTSLETVTEVRSFKPVFAQTAVWLEKNLPNASRNSDFSSTSDSILSLQSANGTGSSAAIGSEAAAYYQVPRIAADIQTEPNITVFANLVRTRPNVAKADRALIGIHNFAETDGETLSAVLSDNGCAFTSDWVIRHAGEIYGVFEVGALPGFSLSDAVTAVEAALKKCFLVGCYSGKTITELECEKHSV